MGKHFVIIAGEEAGPKSNKMGGIWNVIHEEAHTLAVLLDSGTLDTKEEKEILVAGPYYGHRGADWNRGLNRITDMGELSSLSIGGELQKSLEALEKSGIKIFTGEKLVGKTKIGYLQFQTSDFGKIRSTYMGKEMTLESRIKAEAYELLGLDSLRYENMPNGPEYTHYLSLSYAISEFIRLIVSSTPESTETRKAASTQGFIPCPGVSLHCHEFGVFYAPARLKKLGIPVSTVATLHATLPGRTAGYNSIQKRRNNDSTWLPGVPENLAALESLASYADTVTAVGESTRQEARLFYGINGIVIRNGITIESDKIDWNLKESSLERIRKFLSENLYKYHGGERIEPEKIIPIFTISRIEIENKGYPDLLDSLVALERIIKNSILEGYMQEGIRVICFLVTAEGQKTNLPAGFPVNLPKEVLVGNELRIQQMIEERGLDFPKMVRGKRSVAALLYPQILSISDGGLGMEVGEFMAGCCAGIFPSRYDPFLLTGLEAGKEGTPSVVSRVCGFSDAIKTIESLIEVLGGVKVVDNIDLSYYETVLDYALAISYFTRCFIDDRVKYKLLCREAFLLAKDMDWKAPTEQYYELISGARFCKQEYAEDKG
ncbi:MAG: glycosyltransferase family 4 protein [Methanosarcina sp.]|nr:glycosyltransferase family 4 protein [Methanosarcina sp.]MDD3873983.1 glycosyltransferase family 4 protein [Methanosarcina sp.]MDD4522470.1 glycosyltransferase family 4 protein [Methanosarcina sp.]HHV23586.1 glycosyltransferase family 4 protein [Methanosarcina sp.]